MKVLPALVVLMLIVLFVLQNSQSAKVSFLTASGRLPLAIALLAAVALGALFVLTLGSIRILQLRKLIRRSSRRTEAHQHEAGAL
ncbi:MAG: lipopolysaccharide assembly protein LapA domain-containing protein [Actinomycetota bacterium]|nr:lipopolysaccharide assembly protein LapA domain-containing protein [Actinomycetota bacterium]